MSRGAQWDLMRVVKDRGGEVVTCRTEYDHDRGGRVVTLKAFYPGTVGYPQPPAVPPSVCPTCGSEDPAVYGLYCRGAKIADAFHRGGSGVSTTQEDE